MEPYWAVINVIDVGVNALWSALKFGPLGYVWDFVRGSWAPARAVQGEGRSVLLSRIKMVAGQKHRAGLVGARKLGTIAAAVTLVVDGFRILQYRTDSSDLLFMMGFYASAAVSTFMFMQERGQLTLVYMVAAWAATGFVFTRRPCPSMHFTDLRLSGPKEEE
uniref:Uncharacterized protein n=1 Tax=Rhizochromulina marina TaxID=1034831 RepID=A0A7S2WER1_9STRA